jgi:tetratricopeptide (TPR) repeat protein
MVFTDQRDLALTVSDSRPAEIFDQAVDEVVGFQGDPVATLGRALEIDDQFVLAHYLSAMMNIIGNASSRLDEAKLSLDQARQSVDLSTEREQLHGAAVEAWFDLKLDHASNLYHKILSDYPHDLMAMFAGHWLDFYRGDAQSLRGRIARALRAWDELVPGYHWLLGMYAFGLEEMGQYRQAESCGRQAVELNSGDAWGVHAVAHVMEMEGRLEEGVGWLDATSSGWRFTNIKIHNWWHQLLFLIDLGDVEQALQIYDDHLVDPERNDVEALIDRVSALARLSLLDINVAERWSTVVPLWMSMMEDARYPFNDLHALLCFHYGDEQQLAAALMSAVERQYDQASPMMMIGRSVLVGVDAFCRGRNADSLQSLLPVLNEVNRIGGSHAQRDLIRQIALEAAVRDKQWSIAQSLLAERALLRETAPAAFSVHAAGRIQ